MTNESGAQTKVKAPTICNKIEKESDVQRPLILHLCSDFSSRLDQSDFPTYRQYRSRRMQIPTMPSR